MFYRVEYLIYEFVRHTLVEKVAHGIHENLARAAPAQRQIETLRPQREVEAGAERMTGYATETFGEAFRITVVASRADLGAPGGRVPGGVGPLDRCCVRHP